MALLIYSNFGLFTLISAAEKEATQNETLVPEEILQMSTRKDLTDHVFLVDKSKRLLQVFKRDGNNFKKIDEHPTDIGKNDGAKTKRNDRRTPEGIYFLIQKLTQPEIPFDQYGSRAFPTDYPNFFDRRFQRTGD